MTHRFISIILIAVTALCSCHSATAATPFANETLHYVISYKWGLIHKDAGDATLTLRNQGNKYSVMLAAKTKPWADKFYSVRDTLKATMLRNGLKPTYYAKITHEKGKYKKDEIFYSYSGSNTSGRAVRHRLNDSGEMSASTKTLTATGPVYDMLTVFYYLRKINYNELSRNKVFRATVFSGSKKEKITIKSLGKEKIKLKDKTIHEAFHVKFNFTQEGGKKSSDDMDTWISTDDRHIPLYLVGQLPVGEVRAYYLPHK